MMQKISVVIITKNEALNIEQCIESAKLITSDVVVVDCGSIDNTKELARNSGARVIHVEWTCYGASRNSGANHAAFDWIMMLDADERISNELATSIKKTKFTDPAVIFQCKRQNHFFDKKIRLGTMGFDKISRIYHKHYVKWNLFPVHEQLEGLYKKKKILKGPIEHYSIKNLKTFKEKRILYAALSAQKYLQQGKKATFIKRFLAPLFNFSKSYLLQLGFLEGKRGWYLANSIFFYTKMKYKYLYLITHNTNDDIPVVSMHNELKPTAN